MVRLPQLTVRFVSLLLLTALTGLLAQAQTPATPAMQSGKSAATSPQTKATNKASQHRSVNAKKAAAAPEVAHTPPPPPTPEQMAPVPPNVSYQSGQLTIDSSNATLAQILRSVQSKTGASVEIPPSANNERVVAQLGPGRPADVLAKLLSGSKFDYIILGVQDQPGAVQKLILTTRSTGPITNTAQNRPPQPQQQEEAQPEDDYAQPEPPATDENSGAENQNPPPPGTFHPGAINGQTNQNAEFPSQVPPDQQAPQQQGVRTPEQLLQELQRVQQQQQMYQQQLNPANQNPQINQAPQPQQ